MSTNNVTCADGTEHPESECVEYAGEWYLRSDCVEIDGDLIPQDLCRQDYHGEWHLEDDLVPMPTGEWAHPDDDNVCCCFDGEYRWQDDCTWIDDEWYPDHMTYCCGVCEEPGLRSDAYSSPGSGHLCEGCYSNHVSTCCDCGTDVWDDDAISDDHGDRWCRDCYRDQSLVRGYSDKSANDLRPESRDKLLFGIELEVESKTDQESGAEWVRARMSESYCVLKNDGSLSSSGFEIVTRPDSMAVHRRMFHAILNDDPGKRLRSWIGGRCGMHVHVTKSALSQLQLAKMLCFLNDPDNAAFVSTVAGRLPCSWCKVAPKKMSDVRHNPDRYVALNITKRTAEFRIFRGTLLASSFLKNLEFVEALVSYCAPAQRSIKDALSYGEFCKWLDKKTYPHLHSYLCGKGYASLLIRRAA